MPVEPPPTRWILPTPARTDRDGFVGAGADLEPGTMLAAYRTGTFPMPVDGMLGWFSPDPRAVLPVRSTPRRTIRRARRRFTIRVDTAFDDVVAGCADRRRPGGWITSAMRAAYRRLYDLGWAHSVEAWSTRDALSSGGDGSDRLAGALFGVAVGGLFAAESMFHTETDGSKAAVAGLLEILTAVGDGELRLVDVQWTSSHLESLGVVEIPRATYLARLTDALVLPDPFELEDPLAGRRAGV